MKIKKVSRGKRFQYNKNRKRAFKARQSTGKIKVNELKKYWNEKKAVGSNIKEMGLSIDPNRSIPVPNFKQDRLKIVKIVNNIEEEEDEEPKKQRKPKKGFVAEELEKSAKEPRIPQLRLPKGHIKELVYFMDKYQLNYNDMVRDRKNYYQFTAKQFRAKIRKFMSIPEQFNEYLATKQIEPEKFDWKEVEIDED